jgi:hypothetical protein
MRDGGVMARPKVNVDMLEIIGPSGYQAAVSMLRASQNTKAPNAVKRSAFREARSQKSRGQLEWSLSNRGSQ